MYILFCIAIGLGGTVGLFRMNRALAAAVYLILSIGIFVFFGLRWFVFKTGDVASWPPVINSCPDYLTSYQRTTANGTVATCIDLVGVSKNASLKVFPSSGTPPADNDYYFPMNVSATARLTDNISELCTYTRSSGLSWDGIINGEGCVTTNDPNSDVNLRFRVCGFDFNLKNFNLKRK